MTKGSWGASRRSLAQVDHITHDWLTPCDYLPYIDALLKHIDLDPCSTYDANNQFLRAKKIYTYDIDIHMWVHMHIILCYSTVK